MLYPATPVLSTLGVHERLICVSEIGLTVRLFGTDGVVISRVTGISEVTVKFTVVLFPAGSVTASV